MIKRIKKIKNFGIFKNFIWQENVNEFKKFNLIYGWNYSGKTTLSRIFRSFELKEMPSGFETSEYILLDENGTEISHKDLSSHNYHFRVFNIDFIENNLFWEKQEANPLFVLGEKDIKLEKQMRSLKEKIEQLRNIEIEKKKEKERIDNEYENLLSEKAKEIDRIKPPYDKRKFKKVLEEIKDNFEEFCLKDSEIDNLIKSLKEDKKEKISLVSLDTIPSEKEKEIYNYLNKTVVSEIIDRLKENPKLNNWVKEGLKIHQGKSKCEFCGGPLPKNLIERYERHFSEEYEKFIGELNELNNEIEEYRNQADRLRLPDEKRFYPEFENTYGEYKTSLESVIKEYRKELDNIINLINLKIQNPFEKITETPYKSEVTKNIQQIINKINSVIEKHNQRSEKHEEETNIIFQKLERHFASEFAKSYNYFEQKEKIEQLKNEIKEIEMQIQEKEEEIKNIESQFSDIVKAAKKINGYLKNIFGREHLKIQPTDKNKFQILRDEEKAENLSEGEKTAIAFAYFLTRLEDRETDISKAIVFIDDPVSSLDSNHLYNTYALIASKLLDICNQLFISTHNLEFFNLLKEEMKNMKGSKEKCGFYFVERITQGNEEISILKNLPITLLKYKSEYHFLFSKIKSFYESPSEDFESLYQLPNVIRRFLEAFVGFKYSQGLKDGLEFLIDDETHRIMVRKFVNNFSHQTGLQRNLVFSDLEECFHVVKIVLDEIQKKDPEHYKALEDNYNKYKNNN